MELPKYLQIAEEIKEKIRNGNLKPGDSIPSENSLCATYNVSRMTVRKSLFLLSTEGYIASIAGKGSFVKEPDSEKYLLYYNELVNLISRIDRTRLLEVKIVLPPPEVMNSLHLSSNRKIILVKRLFYSNSEKVAYDLKYLIYYKGMPVVEKEIQYGTFPEMVSKYTSLFAIQKELTISAQLPDDEIARQLSLYNHQPLLVVEQKLFNYQKEPIGLGITYYRGDYCKLYARSPFSALE
ncbi:MAG TPA: GntR family transcriptional regulator [Peptococcaceae bacterium]|nr:GntR family transcriptional regulator [Peptococcaceae bacterium]